jgi:hypothetical protein
MTTNPTTHESDSLRRALRYRHGSPAVGGLMAAQAGERASDLLKVPTRFDAAHWFAKPPLGTPWPTACTHHTFETCWFAQHDQKIGGDLYTQIAVLPTHSRSLMVWQTCGIQWWINNNGVTVFPEDHIVDACDKTDVLDCVTGSDIHAAFPHMLFGLSEKARITNTDGRDWINYVLVSFLDNDAPLRATAGRGSFEIDMPRDCPRYVLINMFWKSGFVSSSTVPLRSGVSLKDTVMQLTENTIDDEFRAAVLTPTQLQAEHAEDAAINTRVVSIVFNLCLLMQSYPAYVVRQPGKHDRRLCVRNKPTMPLTFRINDRTAPLIPPPVTEGCSDADAHDAEKRRRGTAHWRRGHWRRQPHTPDWETGNPDVRVVVFPDGRRAHMVWIRPVFVR